MSKRDLKKYLEGLTKEQTADQLLEIYDKFPEVKAYYDFVFRPNEDKLLQDALLKISSEYFPTKTKKAKLRRSVAQKLIKKFLLLGVDPFVITEIMLHNIEVAQRYTAKREVRYSSFYKSMHNSFQQVIDFVSERNIESHFKNRIEMISSVAQKQNWPNAEFFSNSIAFL